MTTDAIAQTHTPTPDVSDWMLVKINALQLLIPRSDVIEVSYLDKKAELVYRKGVFYEASDSSHAYIALSGSLRPLKHIPDNRFIATVTQTSNQKTIGWCWEQVKMINNHRFDFFKLPDVVTSPLSPAAYAAEHEDKLVFYTDGYLLLHYLLSSTKQARFNRAHGHV